MESLCGAPTHRYPNPFQLSLSPRSSPFSKPLISPHKPYSLKPLRASHSPKPSPAPLLKPSLLALAAAAAALLSARFQNPALAAVSVPAAQSEPCRKDSDPITDDEKERILEEHLESHPDDSRSLRALMELKIKSGRVPEAIAIMDRLILVEPGEKDLLLLRAHLQSYSGDSEAAKQGFEELLARDPFLVEAYHGLVMAATRSDGAGDLAGILQRVEGAMELCKKEKRKEDLRDFKLLVAQIQVVEGKYDEARKVYQELVREEPRDFRPYLCLGIIYTLLRKKDEAEKHFEKYRRLVPRGHPYAQYFDDNMTAMKVFSQIEENKRKGTLKV